MNANSLLASPTGLSPYLRFGCLSCRLFYYRLWDLYKKVRAREGGTPCLQVQQGGQGLPDHSATVKRGLPSGPGGEAWVVDFGGASVCTESEKVGRVRIQELAGPSAAQTVDLRKIQVNR